MCWRRSCTRPRTHYWPAAHVRGGVDSADGGGPPVQTAAAEDDGGARQRRLPLFRCRLVEVRLVEGPRARELVAKRQAPGPEGFRPLSVLCPRLVIDMEVDDGTGSR